MEPLEARLLLSGAPVPDGGIETAAATTLTVRFDYSYDVHGFFSAPERRTVLESAANRILSRLTDTLEAIVPGGGNTWSATFSDPSDDSVQVQLDNITIAENEILIFAGGQDLPGGVLGQGGPGGFASGGTAAWNDLVKSRGEPGSLDPIPTDIGLWGGAITFDTLTDWHFGETTQGLDIDESDFMSVALHELAHLFGFGTAESWNGWINAGSFFSGPRSVAEYDLGGAGVPLSPDEGHWLEGTMDEHHETAMDPSIGPGLRKNLTLLDFAGLDDIGWDVIPPLLQPVALAADSSGFNLEMTAGFQEAVINLYDGTAGGFGVADVTLVGASVGPVRGTLVMDGVAGLLRFHKTGSPLEADTYTVTLRSAADGFKDRDGALLDGDSDGTPGGDFVTIFTSDPVPSQLISIPDFARAPGQDIDVPATAANLPIRISDGTGVSKVEVVFRYDSEKFEPTGFAPAQPGGLGIQLAPGWVRFTLNLAAPLGPGPADLIHVIGSIPEAVPYGETSALLLEDPEINDVGAGVADSAVFLAALFGETTGNGSYSSADATRLLRVSVGLDSGFAAYRFTDPTLVGDITGNGVISASDATQVLRLVVGLGSPFIPPPPPAPGSTLLETFAPTLPALSEPASAPSLPPPQDSTVPPNPNARRRLWDWFIAE
jgi:hypothetical protein